MHKLFCPHCGRPVKSTDTFCQHCGYNLADYKARLNGGNEHHVSREAVHHDRVHPQPQPTYIPSRNHSKNHVPLVIAILLVLLMIVFGGVYIYHNNIGPFNSGSNSSLVSKSSAYGSITTTWNHVSNALDADNSSGTDDDFSTDFSGGTGNNSYQGLNAWEKEVHDADDHNDTEVVSITPYSMHMSRSGNKSIVHYKVKYDFKIDSGSSDSHDHIQIFAWTATFNNGSSKIVKTNSPKTPENDYDE